MPVRVIVVRHGERLDEVDRQEWRRIMTIETKEDPPLTAKGWDQAKLAGTKLAAALGEQGGEAKMTIYSSPTSRTLSTACGLIGSLPGKESMAVAPVYSLNCCAAAQHYGVEKAFPKTQPNADVMRAVPLTCWPPLGNPKEVDRRMRTGPGFVAAVKELAALHSDGDIIVLVTHREGIWEILRHVGAKKMKTEYCNISFFNFDLKTATLDGCDSASLSSKAALQAQPQGMFSTPPRKHIVSAQNSTAAVAAGQVVEADVAVEVDTLEGVLASGSGMVMIHRGGRDGAGTSRLWQTPGVRGVWVKGGEVKDGEIVSLMSSPVTSEGQEGDFVLVMRPSGVQGWTKVKNVHLWNKN